MWSALKKKEAKKRDLVRMVDLMVFKEVQHDRETVRCGPHDGKETSRKEVMKDIRMVSREIQ